MKMLNWITSLFKSRSLKNPHQPPIYPPPPDEFSCDEETAEVSRYFNIFEDAHIFMSYHGKGVVMDAFGYRMEVLKSELEQVRLGTIHWFRVKVFCKSQLNK